MISTAKETLADVSQRYVSSGTSMMPLAYKLWTRQEGCSGTRSPVLIIFIGTEPSLYTTAVYCRTSNSATVITLIELNVCHW